MIDSRTFEGRDAQMDGARVRGACEAGFEEATMAILAIFTGSINAYPTIAKYGI